MTKPDLPYNHQHRHNLDRTAELYPPDRKSFAMGGSRSMAQVGKDYRHELTRGVNGK